METKVESAYDALMHVLSLRKRNRKDIPLQSLLLAAQKNGFKYPREAYAEAFKLLARKGVGMIEYSRRGKVKRLKDVTIPIKQIASNKESLLKTLVTEQAAPKTLVERNYLVQFIIAIDGQDIVFPLKRKMTMKSFNQLVGTFQNE